MLARLKKENLEWRFCEMTGVILTNEFGNREKRKLIEKFDGKVAYVRDSAFGYLRGIVMNGGKESYSLQQFDGSFAHLFYSDLEKVIACNLVVSVDF